MGEEYISTGLFYLIPHWTHGHYVPASAGTVSNKSRTGDGGVSGNGSGGCWAADTVSIDHRWLTGTGRQSCVRISKQVFTMQGRYMGTGVRIGVLIIGDFTCSSTTFNWEHRW